MNKIFLDDGWEHFNYWIHENRSIADKIYKLLQDIERNGAASGLGKPEHLKHKDCWSRRINDEHRLLYNVINNSIYVISPVAFFHLSPCLILPPSAGTSEFFAK